MTTSNDVVVSPALQSLITLRDSIDVISCAADLVSDNFDESGLAIGMLFKRLSERLQDDFKAFSCEAILKL